MVTSEYTTYERLAQKLERCEFPCDQREPRTPLPAEAR